MRAPAPLAVAVLALSLLLGVGAATAANAGEPGGLDFAGCLTSHGGGCGRLPVPLDGASAVAVSRDGREVYVSAFAAGTVAGLARGPGGSLRFRDCIAEATVAGCVAAPAGTLAGAAGLALSPSGADLYVAADEADGVARLSRRGGKLAFGGSVTASSLGGAAALALGPGGSDVYVASLEAGAVTRLARAADGTLHPAGCLAFGGAFGCHGIPGNSLVGADALALSPDGHDLYVASFASGTVVELRRRPSGALVYRGCIAEGGADQCRKLPKGSLSGASGIAVSPDGDDVYVAAQVGTVTRLRRSPHGRLTFSGCLATRGLGGCAKAPGELLKGATGIAVAPNGGDLYLTAQRADAVVHLRTTGRSLRVAGCVAAQRTAGCGRVPGAALGGPYGVAVAPSGTAVYTTAAADGAVAGFARREAGGVTGAGRRAGRQLTRPQR